MSSLRSGAGYQASGAASSVCGEEDGADAAVADNEVSASHSGSCRQGASAGGDGEVVSVAPPFSCHAEVSDGPPGPAPPAAAASTWHSGDCRFSPPSADLLARNGGPAMHAGAGGECAGQGADGRISLKRRRDGASQAERDCTGVAPFQQQALQQAARKESTSSKLVTSSGAGGVMEDYYKKKLQAVQKKFQVELKVKERMHDITKASLQEVSSQLESLQSVHGDAAGELASLRHHHRELQKQVDKAAGVEEQRARIIARLEAEVKEQGQARVCAERKCQQLMGELQGKDKELSMKLKEALAGKSFKWKDMLTKEKKQQKKATTALESELQKSKNLANAANAKLKAAQQKLEETGQELDAARARLKAGAKAEKQVKALKVSHGKERASLKAGKEELLLLRKQVQAHEKGQDERAVVLRKEHEEELAGLHKLHSEEVNSLQEELQRLRKMHEMTLASFLQTKEGEFLSLRQENEQRVALLVKEHESGKAELQAAHKLEVEALQGRYKEVDDRLLETLALLTNRTRADEETQSKVKMYEQRLGALDREREEASKLQKRSDKQVADLQKQIVALEKDNARLEAVLEQRDELLQNHDRVGEEWQAAIEEAQDAIAEVRETAAKSVPSVHMLSSLQRENEGLKSQLEFTGPLKEVLAAVTKQKEDLEAALASAVKLHDETLEWTVRRHEEALASTEEKLLSLENENEDLKARLFQETFYADEPEEDPLDPEASPASGMEDTSMEVPDSEEEDEDDEDVGEEFGEDSLHDFCALLESQGGAQPITVAGGNAADVGLVAEGFVPSISDIGVVTTGSVCSTLEIGLVASGSVPSTSGIGAVAAGSVPSTSDIGVAVAGSVPSTSDTGVAAASSVPPTPDIGVTATSSVPPTPDIGVAAASSVPPTPDIGVDAGSTAPSTSNIGVAAASLIPSTSGIGVVAAGSVPSTSDLGAVSARSVPFTLDIGAVAAGSVPSTSDIGVAAASSVSSTSDVGVVAAGSVPSTSELGAVAACSVPSTSDLGAGAGWSVPFTSDLGAVAACSVPSTSDIGAVAAGSVPSTSNIGVAAASSVPSTPDIGVGAAGSVPSMKPQVWLDSNLHPQIEPVTTDIRDSISMEGQVVLDVNTDPLSVPVTAEMQDSGGAAVSVSGREADSPADPSDGPLVSLPVTVGIPGNGDPLGALPSNTEPAFELGSEQPPLVTEGIPEGAWLNLETVQTIIRHQDAVFTGDVRFIELEPSHASSPSAPEYTSSETPPGADAELYLESRDTDSPQVLDIGQDLADAGAIASVECEPTSTSALQLLSGYYTEVESMDAEDAGKNTGGHPPSELCPNTVLHHPGHLDPYSVCSDIIPYRPFRVECSFPCPSTPKLSLRSLKRKARRVLTDDSSRSAKRLVLWQ